MNILILNWRDPKHPLAGGAETMLWEHALYWKKKGAKVTWVASHFPNGKMEEKIDAITIKRIGTHYTVHLKVVELVLSGRLSGYDIVIDCFHFLPFFAPLLFPKKKIVALIHEVAGKVWFENMILPLALLGYILEPFFFILYRKIPFITVSDSTKEELEGLGIPKDHITVIPNGITLPRKMPDNSKTSYPSLLFLNRLSLDKGFIDGIKAYELVKRVIPPVRFFIAGKEQTNGSVDKILQAHPVKDMIYEGYVNEEKKWELLKKSWILIHPSSKEGWGLTVIEANSMGTPVIGYDVAGLKDSIQDGKTGVLTGTNYKSLATEIITLLGNKEKLNILSQNAKMWAATFSWRKSTQKSWELLSS